MGEIQSISWDNVAFKYTQSDSIIFSNVNMTWNKNDRIAIMGKSGSGKTTVFKLLLKYFDDYEGEIKINGVELRQISLMSLYQQIGVISQSPYIFNDTIKNNICLYENFDEYELEKALKLSGVDEFTRSMPEGVNTMILENGKNISGGQAQRIAIARAVIRKKSVLLVDEGTNGLDSALSGEIMNSILSLDAMVIVVTHDRNSGYNSRFNMKYEIIDKKIVVVGY